MRQIRCELEGFIGPIDPILEGPREGQWQVRIWTDWRYRYDHEGD